MNPTIKDVAERANVSIATVSRVVNHLSGYSEKTKKRVYQAIEEIGYQPNAIARGLINKRTHTIGVMFPSVSSMFSSDILHGVEDLAHHLNYSVVVCNTDSDGKRTMKYLQVLREKQVDGLIFSSEVLKEEYHSVLEKMRIPIVLTSSKTQYADVPHVKVDDYQASFDAVDYLISKGHRNIAMISGTKTDKIAGLPRVRGYKKALEKHRIPFRPDLLAYGDFMFDQGYIAMETLLKRAPDLTAVFAASDEMAVAAMAAAAKHGLRVPDDLSVMGYDDTKLAAMVYPPLTAIRQPLHDLGRIACKKLIHMIETGEIEKNEIVPHSIVERQTVKALANE